MQANGVYIQCKPMVVTFPTYYNNVFFIINRVLNISIHTLRTYSADYVETEMYSMYCIPLRFMIEFPVNTL